MSQSEMKIAIVEDQKQNLERLLAFLDEFDLQYTLVGTAKNVKEGEKLLLTKKVDLLFLDMKLPDGEGTELLDRLPQRDFKVIFFTAHKDYALSAFEYGSVDFVLKPIQLKDLNRALKKVIGLDQKLEEHSTSNKVLPIPHKEGTLYIERDKILYFQAYGEYCYLVTEQKKELVSRTLKDIEDSLKDNSFVRTHRSYIVNLNKVKYYQKKGLSHLVLSNEKEIPISRRKRLEIAEIMKSSL